MFPFLNVATGQLIDSDRWDSNSWLGLHSCWTALATSLTSHGASQATLSSPGAFHVRTCARHSRGGVGGGWDLLILLLAAHGWVAWGMGG